MDKTVMIVGIGDLAGLVLNHLVQRPRFGKIILAGRNMGEMTQRKNLALLFAAQLGYYHDIECVAMDLFQIDQTAETITKLKPDIIFNTATLQSWRIITYLPKEIFEALDEAQFGPWLPMHLTLVHKLMLAVRSSGCQPVVVNTAFPDAVGPVLQTAGLAPHLGIGNVANVIPALRGAIGLSFHVPLERVRVSLFTQHYFSHRLPTFGDSGGAPYFLKAMVDNEDVTSRLNMEQVFATVKTGFKKTGGAFRQLITAASSLAVLLPLIGDLDEVVHAPAPHGLTGGYQIRINRGEITVALPEGLSLEQAIKINTDCQKLDGIETIEASGTVYFTEQKMQILKQMLNYECLTMKLEDSEMRARELGQKFREFAAQYGA